MRGQVKKGLQVFTILLALGGFCFAESIPNTAIAPNPTTPDTQSWSRAAKMPPPGAVNYIEGQVSVSGEPVTAESAKSTVLQPGEVLSTQDGYAEVLLTPGAFLRVGHNSAVRMEANGLINVRLDVLHGSAMIEVADFTKGTSMDVAMNGATTRIEKNGLYDFEADQGAIRVLKGKAQVIEADKKTTLNNRDQVLLSSAKPLKSRSVDMKAAEHEPIYVWSKVRSQEESQASQQLARDVIINGGWYGPGWYWNPYWGGYGFLPAWGALYGPFGWGYYSPAFIIGGGYYPGYWGHGYWRHGWHSAAGVRAFHSAPNGGFHGGVHGGFHGSIGGFHGGAAGFHGGGGRR